MCFYSSGKSCFTTHIYDVKSKEEEENDTQDDTQDNVQEEKVEGKEDV